MILANLTRKDATKIQVSKYKQKGKVLTALVKADKTSSLLYLLENTGYHHLFTPFSPLIYTKVINSPPGFASEFQITHINQKFEY